VNSDGIIGQTIFDQQNNTSEHSYLARNWSLLLAFPHTFTPLLNASSRFSNLPLDLEEVIIALVMRAVYSVKIMINPTW
jgi:hypothetical protein